MSEHDSVWPLFRSQSEHEAAATGAADRPPAPSAGQMLRSAREAAGLHAVALAAALKVSVKRIQKIEADELQTEQDIVFTRALIGSVCRHLKIDPRPILEALPKSQPVVLSDLHDEGLQTPFHAPGQASTGWPRGLKRPVVWLVALLLIGTAAVLLWPDTLQKAEPGAADRAFRAPGEAPMASSAPVPLAQGVGAALPVAEPTVGSTTTPPSTPAAPGAVAPAPTPAVTGTALGAGETNLSLKARSTTWVEVTDGKANVLLRRTLVAGEGLDLQGPAPLSVVLGRADQIEVLVHGRLLDLKPYSHDNVARFEVRP